jgi:ABC-type nitrate/sulfonate/bicarbonate transport system substrate-binding protein
VSTRLAVGAFSASVLLRVARRTGRLAEQGLIVEETAVASSPAQFRALLDGSLDAALTSPDNVLAYRYGTNNPLGRVADARIVAAVDRGLGLALYARPGLSSAEALSGATIGVDVPTSGFALAMYAATESIGLSRDAYHLAALGATPKRLAALLAGECAATMLNAGNDLLAEQAGCTALVRVTDVCAPYLGTVLAVVGDARLEPVTRLALALRRTAAQIRAGALDEVTASAAATALDLPPDLARRYVHQLKHPLDGLVVDGVVEPAALRTVVDLRRRYLPADGGARGADPMADAVTPGSLLLTPAATTPAPAR